MEKFCTSYVSNKSPDEVVAAVKAIGLQCRISRGTTETTGGMRAHTTVSLKIETQENWNKFADLRSILSGCKIRNGLFKVVHRDPVFLEGGAK